MALITLVADLCTMEPHLYHDTTPTIPDPPPVPVLFEGGEASDEDDRDDISGGATLAKYSWRSRCSEPPAKYLTGGRGTFEGPHGHHTQIDRVKVKGDVRQIPYAIQ